MSKLDERVFIFLKATPHLEFSETGLQNIAKRFGITVERLLVMIDAYGKKQKTVK